MIITINTITKEIELHESLTPKEISEILNIDLKEYKIKKNYSIPFIKYYTTYPQTNPFIISDYPFFSTTIIS